MPFPCEVLENEFHHVNRPIVDVDDAFPEAVASTVDAASMTAAENLGGSSESFVSCSFQIWSPAKAGARSVGRARRPVFAARVRADAITLGGNSALHKGPAVIS